MITTAVLALITVLIYESFFITLDAFYYCYDYLNIAPFANEKLWQAQNELTRFGFVSPLERASGELVVRNKNFRWERSDYMIDEASPFILYKAGVTISWQEGRKNRTLSRSAYALYKAQEL